MANSVDLKHLEAFLSSKSPHCDPSPLQLHLLRGWKESTLRSYNGAVKKFLAYWTSTKTRPFVLPASPADIYGFCWWAGRVDGESTSHDISSKTLVNYLSGLKAWHLYHDVLYPHVTADRVTVMIRASARADSLLPVKPPKPAILIEHLLALYMKLNGSSPQDEAVLDCAICAFWGLARLGELTYDSGNGKPEWINSVLCSDAIGSDLSITLHVRGAKTAKAGQAQPLLLNAQPNILCPVKAVQHRLLTSLEPTDSLFGFWNGEGRTNLTRSRVIKRCKEVWDLEGWTSLSGHSFRVGGASLRNALGVPHKDIQTLGRWTSSCYLIYLRDYSADELRRTTSMIELLNSTRVQLDS